MSNQQKPLLVTVSAYCDKPGADITVTVTSNTATTFEEAIKTIKLAAKTIHDNITEYYEFLERNDYTEIRATVDTETGPVSCIVETELTVYGVVCKLCYELHDEKELDK